jgi:hypothetical protein
MHASTPATPSDEAMLAAWQQLRQRDWPTLAELKRAAALYRLVHGQAMRKAQPAQAATAVQTPAPAQTRPAPSSVRVPHHPPIFDHKRAAAGERDDD